MPYIIDHKEFLEKRILWLEYQNSLMEKFNVEDTFLASFNHEVSIHGCESLAFSELNTIYTSLFGKKRYESLEDFKNIIMPYYKKKLSIEILERNFLLAYFKSKGFTTFEIFRPMVLVYYPEINVAKLKLFFENKTIDTEVLKYVGNVYQIIKPL